jgi:hypothetical protein
MHCVKHVVSPLDNEDPGLGTHFSKQCSLTFYTIVSTEKRQVEVEGRSMITSINCRAFVIAASCLTWFITAALGSVAPNPRPLLMLSIFADIESRICAGRDRDREREV